MSLFGRFPKRATLEVGGVKIMSLTTSSSSSLGEMVASAVVGNLVNAAIEYVILPVAHGAVDAVTNLIKKNA